MNRTLLLVLLFIVLGIGAWFALRKKAGDHSSGASWDMEFGVKDPSVIHKIFLADRNGKQITLRREGDHWLVNDLYKARPTAMRNLMEVIENAVVWYVPPKNAESNMVKSLVSDGIKVELYNKENTRIKTYYVGGVTNDERGTFMMMEGSDQPYVVHLPYLLGQLRVRFMLNEDDWRDRAVFSEKPESVQSISVVYPQMKNKSFKVEKTGAAEFSVSPYYSTTPVNKAPQRKGFAEAYVLTFENLVAEAFENNYPKRDSVTALVPFAIVTVKTEDGAEKEARFWPVEVKQYMETGEPFVERYFTETNQPSFMLTQPRVFGPVFREYNAFFEAPVRN